MSIVANERSAAPKPAAVDDFAYTKQFFTLTRQGHIRTTQSFGAPSLIWHTAFWPKRKVDPQDTDPAQGDDWATKVETEYNRRRKKVVEDLSTLLMRLQERGRAGTRVEWETFGDPNPPSDREADDDGHQLLAVYARESISLTLWWSPDDDPIAARTLRQPKSTDIRVRVQADLYTDFSTLTFVIDAGKPWNEPPVYTHAKATGARRQSIFQHAEDVRRLCDARAKDDSLIGKPLLPEADGAAFASDAKKLKEAADYLYDGVWTDFCRDFGFDITDIAGTTDRVFASFRGAVLSTNGYDLTTTRSIAGVDEPDAEPGQKKLGRFDKDTTEPNSVVKAYWPFVRRMRPEADFRDWIACGVFDWRALYITAVGAQSEYDQLDESEGWKTDVPAGHLPERRLRQNLPNPPDWMSETLRDAPTTPEGDRPSPFRYLILTKGEPHPRQVGRMIERVNSLGTLRLFALRNWSIIRDADFRIRMYGQRLDDVVESWKTKATKRVTLYRKTQEKQATEQRQKLNEFCAKATGEFRSLITQRLEQRVNSSLDHRRMLEDLLDDAKRTTKGTPLVPKNAAPQDDLNTFVRALYAEARRLKSQKDEDLAAINQKAETELIEINSRLDSLGQDAIGGLPFRLNRALYYADLYRAQVPTLRSGHIDTWWAYDQFADRAVEPSFRFIASVAERLGKLRQRLSSATESVQTSAIVNQTEATRDNTYQLEIISTELNMMTRKMEAIVQSVGKWQRWAAIAGLVGSVLGSFLTLLGFFLKDKLPNLLW